MEKFEELYTEEGLGIKGMPWNAYPRPQLKRHSFVCLNGKWSFGVKHKEELLWLENITVPFAPETLLSGVGIDLHEDKYDAFVYRKHFSLENGFNRGRVLLHFGGVSNYAEVVLNGHTLGIHRGAYEPFFFDITDKLEETNTLEVYAKNILGDNLLPYGKQSRKRGGMWYTPTSGIWQTVWLESVPERHITALKVETDGLCVTIKAEGADNASVIVETEKGEATYKMTGGVCEFELDYVRLWSPEDPYLYYYTVDTGEDKVESYFAVRTLEIRRVDGYERLCLNGQPYFFHGLLDQGYWSDGGMTPPSFTSYDKDIKAMKALGFNMLRKHIKIEPAAFYYACDRLGMIVFQDMVNNGDYSFFRDTALPTVGLRNIDDRKLHTNEATRDVFVDSMKKTVELLGGYPSICCWTIFNEGWGQFCGTEMYNKLKEIDSTRFIDTASGWFSNVESDVDSRHIYFKKVKLKAGKKPLVLSEFGGYSYRVKGHIFNPKNEYGYGKYKTAEEFSRAFCRLYREEIIPLAKKGLCASVYTQVSDVEDETNGLFTYDRRVLKIKAEDFLPISEELKRI